MKFARNKIGILNSKLGRDFYSVLHAVGAETNSPINLSTSKAILVL